jgi:membrane dipeptidase
MEGLYKKVADSLNIPWYKRSERDSLNAMEMENYLETYPTVKSLANEKAGNDPEAPPAVDVADLVNHIDYMVNRIGIDHVGISSDFDGGGGIEGWKDASETFNVTLELVRRGYSEEEIAKLWSGNLLRVLDEVQRLAR